MRVETSLEESLDSAAVRIIETRDFREKECRGFLRGETKRRKLGGFERSRIDIGIRRGRGRRDPTGGKIWFGRVSIQD